MKELKGKVRGKPFKKGNVRGKVLSEVSEENEIFSEFHTDSTLAIDSITKDSFISKEKDKTLELIDKIEFKNGENTLTIRFSKKNNRMYRIQVFLNDKIEVRPVTYTGSSTGNTFWEVLKGGLK